MNKLFAFLIVLALAGCTDPRVALILAGAKDKCQVILDAGPIIKIVAAADVSGTASGVAAIVDAICTQVVAKKETQALTSDNCLAYVNGVCVTGKREP
jgi:hypothetical protein